MRKCTSSTIQTFILLYMPETSKPFSFLSFSLLADVQWTAGETFSSSRSDSVAEAGSSLFSSQF